jgi:hypothetical protein
VELRVWVGDGVDNEWDGGVGVLARCHASDRLWCGQHEQSRWMWTDFYPSKNIRWGADTDPVGARVLSIAKELCVCVWCVCTSAWFLKNLRLTIYTQPNCIFHLQALPFSNIQTLTFNDIQTLSFITITAYRTQLHSYFVTICRHRVSIRTLSFINIHTSQNILYIL